MKPNLLRHCREIFEKIRPQLIKDYLNWFVAIEADTEDYFIDADWEVAKQKARQKYPDGKILIYQLKPPISSEEKAKQEAERQAFSQRCRAIFERVRPELIEEHYNWFITIEPDSGDYFIDKDDMTAYQKAREKHPQTIFCTFRLNETGVCGRI